MMKNPKTTIQILAAMLIVSMVAFIRSAYQNGKTNKHKFLWWRWGTKGYQVQIVNFNPHPRINYSRNVEVVK